VRSKGIRSPHDVQESKSTGFGFLLVILFLVLEYGRPQDKFGVIGALRPTLVLIPLMLITWLKHGNIRLVASPQSSCIVLMLCLLALHVPFATNNFLAYKQTEGFFLLLPFLISVVLFVDRYERLHAFMRWWILLAFYIAINGILGFGVAGSSFLGDENDVALLINVMLPFALCLFLYERKWIVKLAYMVTSLLCVASIVSSGSRGGLVGLLVVLAVVWLMSPRKVLSLVLIAVLAVGVYGVSDQKYWDRMETIKKTDEGTAKGRLDSWQAGWDMFKDHPLGVGPGNFPVRFPEYQPASLPHNMWGRAAHSLWFTLLAELGIPGTILYLFLLGANLRDLRYLKKLSMDSDSHRFAHVLSIAFMASLAGFFASGTFLSVLFYPHYWYLSAMIVATRKIVDNADTSKSMALERGLEIGKS